MITDALLNLMHTLLRGLVALLPAWTIDMDTAHVDLLRQELTKLANFIPITALVFMLSLHAAAFAATVLFRWLKWVVDSIIAVIP